MDYVDLKARIERIEKILRVCPICNGEGATRSERNIGAYGTTLCWHVCDFCKGTGIRLGFWDGNERLTLLAKKANLDKF